MSRDDRNWAAITLEATSRRARKENMTTDLAVREAPAPVPASPGLFGTDNPKAVISKAATVAGLLKDVVDKQGLIKNISGKQYILAEGWTTLGAMVGVFPKVEYSKPVLDGEGNKVGWEAAVEVVNAQGVVIGRAEAECLREEKNWKNRDDFALRSMAQTRAMGKALRMPLGFIAAFAGYEATPAEEMPDDSDLPFEHGPASQAARSGAAKAGGAAPIQPFEPGVTGSKTGAQGQPGLSNQERNPVMADTGASAFADEKRDIPAFLELAASVGEDAHNKAMDFLADQRSKNNDKVPAAKLAEASKRLAKQLEKAAA